ncbi:chemotaxis protein methyltransferase CheR [Dyella jiangningensis]|uniref:CheR family methyltransferase n=1 Tax=Dyella sp. AtDHG13 TaxID=1938897 RepID=UPI0008910E2A|nr:protein-glutamate O-methyltransferase CheR [Dyella sp. AtDHG13]PXV61795.1 chemotaxis protein methyltransferase CheR [Dyella sp. AtDHG13]SDJ63604.1 chemotaxis protein methyltransferase CheR [Dyella jiangningensis]
MEIESEIDVGVQRALLDKVRRHTGIHMADRKWTLLQGRLRRRLQALELSRYRDYLAVLDAQPEEVGAFINLVTTNETSFFRTPRIWDHFRQQLLPEWFRQHRGATLQLWSAAASTGEEAYSMAMLCEEFREHHPAFKYQILATDIASHVLATGKAGHYQGKSIEGLRRTHPELAAKYFQPSGEGYLASPSLRAHVLFREHHLHRRLDGAARFDIALLRNVLIYFDEEGQCSVLENVHRAMAPGGVLVIGESESLTRLNVGFEFEQPLIYRRGERAHA